MAVSRGQPWSAVNNRGQSWTAVVNHGQSWFNVVQVTRTQQNASVVAGAIRGGG